MTSPLALPNPLKVAVYAASPLYRQALVRLLCGAGADAVEACTESVEKAGEGAGEGGPGIATGGRVDVLVVDADQPAQARQVVARLRGADAQPLVLIAPTDGPWFRRLAGQLGAGLVSRHDPPERLVEEVRRSACGDICAGPRGRAPEAEVLLAAHLTDREHQVLVAMAAGTRNDALAAALGISPNTARTHVRNVLAKLCVGSRRDAVDLARRVGIVGAERHGA